jgi:hypothetical protein
MLEKQIEDIAEVIYNSWVGPDFVKWARGGNSNKQAEARSLALKVMGLAVPGKPDQPFPYPHHFHRLVKHAERQDEEIFRLKRELHTFQYYKSDEFWGWQADGDNFLDSITCPILIAANDMRDIVNKVNFKSLENVR